MLFDDIKALIHKPTLSLLLVFLIAPVTFVQAKGTEMVIIAKEDHKACL